MLSVVVCTWNRAPLLRQCLERLSALRDPGCDWEVVVVDNNSDDGTAGVIGEFADRLPLVAVHERRPGLSHARNAGLATARGDYLLWTDDDVLVDPDWLVAYARAIARYPDAAVFGGPILPRYEGCPPDWLLASWSQIDIAYAARDLGETAFALRADGNALPYGANYAVRAREQRRFPYDPGLGRTQSSRLLLSGEETLVIRSILRTGATGWWLPQARVEHWISAGRQTTGYVRLYFESRGRMNAAVGGGEGVPRLFGRPRWAWRQALVGELRYRLLRPWRPATHWVDAMVRASEAWGVLKGPP